MTVAPDVSLEILDWGGSGEPLVFLAGLGNTAHVFDELAPTFTDRFRVLGMTRRGFGASSQPASGYDIETRIADLLAVVDSLGVQKANLVGHSIAGGELTGFGVRHPDRVRRLVYLDAGYDPTILSGGARPPFPIMTAADSASPAAMLAFSSLLGQAIPEADLRATVVFDSTGKALRDVTPGAIQGAILQGVESPPWNRVEAPALALYSLYESPQAALSPGWWSRLDSAGRKQALEAIAPMAPWSTRNRNRFRSEMKSAVVVELPGANHYVWLTNREQVVAEMRGFLEKP